MGWVGWGRAGAVQVVSGWVGSGRVKSVWVGFVGPGRVGSGRGLCRVGLGPGRGGAEAEAEEMEMEEGGL